MKRSPAGSQRLRTGYTRVPSRGRKQEGYGEFRASELYCQKCGMAVPVRERLLLVLPDGELYEYLCIRCGASVGEKTTRGREDARIVIS
jgi:hypothetical protein